MTVCGICGIIGIIFRDKESEKPVMYDVAVIGTGAAGVSAALTLKALHQNFIWFGPQTLSAKIASAEKIRNYPGLPLVSGGEMREIFLRQTAEMEIEITPKNVTGIYPTNGHYTLLCNREMYEAKTVILCTGVESVRPIPGELEFVGRGVSYCAVCDGFLYQGKTIAVECTSKELEHEIEMLASLAAKVYLVPLYKDAAVSAENIDVIRKKPLAIEGGQRAERLVFDDRAVEVDGIFMLKQAVAPSVLLNGLETADGHIVVDRSCAANLKGCFAAGDCTGRPYQYAKAVGEGNVAAHAAAAFAAESEKQKGD